MLPSFCNCEMLVKPAKERFLISRAQPLSTRPLSKANNEGKMWLDGASGWIFAWSCFTQPVGARAALYVQLLEWGMNFPCVMMFSYKVGVFLS